MHNPFHLLKATKHTTTVRPHYRLCTLVYILQVDCKGTFGLGKATPSDTLVSDPPPHQILFYLLSPVHVQNDHVVQNKCDKDIHLQNNEIHKVKPIIRPHAIREVSGPER